MSLNEITIIQLAAKALEAALNDAPDLTGLPWTIKEYRVFFGILSELAGKPKKETKLSREQKMRNSAGNLMVSLADYSYKELLGFFSSSEYKKFTDHLVRLVTEPVEIKEVTDKGFVRTEFTPRRGKCEKCANTKCREIHTGYFFSAKMPCFVPIKDEGKTNLPTVDDELIEALSGALSEEMVEHITQYHEGQFDLKACFACGKWAGVLFHDGADDICMACVCAKAREEQR